MVAVVVERASRAGATANARAPKAKPARPAISDDVCPSVLRARDEA